MNFQARQISLNATLVLLFACAVASDRSPKSATALVFLAAAIIAAELVYLVATTKRAQPKGGAAEIAELERVGMPRVADQKAQGAEPSGGEIQMAYVETVTAREAATRIAADALDEVYLSHLATVSRAFANRVYRARASDILTWNMAAPNEQLMIEYIKPLVLGHNKYAPTIIDTWKIIDFEPEVFNVEAGAFEIEHIHGKTLIRVLDQKAVTVENYTPILPAREIAEGWGGALGSGGKKKISRV